MNKLSQKPKFQHALSSKPLWTYNIDTAQAYPPYDETLLFLEE